MVFNIKSRTDETPVAAESEKSDSSEASIIVWSMRIPRTLVGIVTGAAFGVAGALIQALTRNPLADPGAVWGS